MEETKHKSITLFFHSLCRNGYGKLDIACYFLMSKTTGLH